MGLDMRSCADIDILGFQHVNVCFVENPPKNLHHEVRGVSKFLIFIYLEYEELISRDSVWEGVPVSREEREMLFDDFCAAARWQRVYFLWRPNLPDASDDHVMDLAVACGVEHLVTHNVRDFQRGELHFSLPEVVTPLQHLEKNR